ncbi:MAG: PD-(D/E)XK nuclease family protein, partial [Alphaproteobacteria bacterium]|nr:PD-(D/E)XK nuclease family protein [Alphaproteobacteria bacterium]
MPIHTIPLSAPYLKTLAEGIVRRFDQDLRPYVTVILPSNRAVISLQKVFTKFHPNIVLPKIVTISKVYQELAYQYGTPTHLQAFANLKLINEIERRYLMTWALKECNVTEFGFHGNISQLDTMCSNIISLLDEAHLSGLSTKELLNHIERSHHDYPHQSVLYECLKKYSEHLAQRGLVDPKIKLCHDMDCVIHNIQTYLANDGALHNPIVLAGTTGTIPAVRTFAKHLLAYDNGHVVLPGLENGLFTYPLTHPLYTQSIFVQEMNYKRDAYPLWHPVPEARPIQAFFDTHRQTMQPIEHYTFLKARNLLHEAQIVATIVRHHIETTPHQDIAIVCAHPQLSMYIQNCLARYEFQANSSLAMPVTHTSGYQFMLAAMRYQIKQDCAHVLNVIKHPLFYHEDKEAILKNIDDIEKNITIADDGVLGQITDLVPHIRDIPFYGSYTWAGYHHQLFQYIDALSHGAFAASREGQHIIRYFQSIHTVYGNDNTQHPLYACAQWFEAMLSHCPDMPNDAHLHQHVTMVGSLEARHMSAPIVILTALNEGQWPPTIKHDVWLTKKQRHDLDMPSPERRLGLSAHDFASNLSAECVYFTRSVKVDGVPAQESRWLRRIQTFCAQSPDQDERASYFLNVVDQLYHQGVSDQGNVRNQSEDSFPWHYAPPKTISISAIELLNKNPYLFYCRYILGLRARSPWFLGLSPAHIGTKIHDILQNLDFQNPQPYGDILSVLKPLHLPEAQTFFLTKQIMTMVQAVLNETPPLLKMEREKTLRMRHGDVCIQGRADRIDQRSDGLYIIDYKTGTEPTKAMIKNG